MPATPSGPLALESEDFSAPDVTDPGRSGRERNRAVAGRILENRAAQRPNSFVRSAKGPSQSAGVAEGRL